MSEAIKSGAGFGGAFDPEMHNGGGFGTSSPVAAVEAAPAVQTHANAPVMPPDPHLTAQAGDAAQPQVKE